MQTATTPVRNGGGRGGGGGSSAYPMNRPSTAKNSAGHGPTRAEKEMVVAHIRRLMAEAEAFFVRQQQLLKMTYNELSIHVDQLKYRAQFFVSAPDEVASVASSGNRHNFSVPMPLTALTAGAAMAGGFPFGAGAHVGGGLVDVAYGANPLMQQQPRQQMPLPQHPQQQQQSPAAGGPPGNMMSATPLRPNMHQNNSNMSLQTPNFTVSPLPSRHTQQSPDFLASGFQVSGSNNVHAMDSTNSAALGGSGAFTYSTAALNLVTGTSTPPNKHLRLATDSKSPSLSALLEDNVVARSGTAGTGSPDNDWGSLSLANNTASSLDNTQTFMASPQFTNTLSLDDLLARFVRASSEGGDGGVTAMNTKAASALPPTAATDAAFSFDTLYAQLVSGEKSRGPEHDGGRASAWEDTTHQRSSQKDRFADMGFAVTAGDAKRPTAAVGGAASAVSVGVGVTGGGGAGLAGGSLFDRNTAAPGPSTGKGGAADRFNFGSATQMFSTAARCTPTKQAQPSVPHSSSLGTETSPSYSSGNPQHQRAPLTQHADPAASAYALLNSFDKKDVIPIDSIRSLCDHHLTQTVRAVYEQGRPRVEPIPGSEGKTDDPASLGVDRNSSCQVLVEFKRKRVLQYDSESFVPPGTYVVVGGDRGEDLGLVIYTWCETTKKALSAEASGGLPTARKDAEGKQATSPKRGDGAGDTARAKTDGGKGSTVAASSSTVVGIGLAGSTLTRSIGVGNGTVLRLATDGDVAKLLGVQAELEVRAVDVCGQRVLDHALPMVIVDAEYQFDKKKLTFFYEAQQRMDFRELVRDLYKTFRARIWMELVDS